MICNGFKDRDYIELALRALRAGTQDPPHLRDDPRGARGRRGRRARSASSPLIGFRARLHTEGVGKWQDSGGTHAKFGLSTTELLEAHHLPAGSGPHELR